MPAIGFALIGRETKPYQGQPVAGRAGVLLATVPAVAGGEAMQIERVYVFSTSTQPATARLYVDKEAPGNAMDLTLSGIEDLADELNPIWVPGGQQFLVVWSGLSNLDAGGAPTIAVARVQWSHVKQGAG